MLLLFQQHQHEYHGDADQQHHESANCHGQRDRLDVQPLQPILLLVAHQWVGGYVGVGIAPIPVRFSMIVHRINCPTRRGVGDHLAPIRIAYQHSALMESSDCDLDNEFSERIGFHFLHDAHAVFLDGANRNS
jgi:hypothetical protein